MRHPGGVVYLSWHSLLRSSALRASTRGPRSDDPSGALPLRDRQAGALGEESPAADLLCIAVKIKFVSPVPIMLTPVPEDSLRGSDESSGRADHTIMRLLHEVHNQQPLVEGVRLVRPVRLVRLANKPGVYHEKPPHIARVNYNQYLSKAKTTHSS